MLQLSHKLLAISLLVILFFTSSCGEINRPFKPENKSLPSFKDTSILKNSIITSLCRVLLGPLIGFAIIYNFNLSGFAAWVLLIQSAMPSAILNYLVGSMYSPKKVVDSIASTIVISTLMSFITIPLVVFLALKYFS